MLKDPKDLIAEIVSQVGKAGARKFLEGAKINESTAEKLVAGRYESEVGFLLAQKIYQAHSSSKRKQSA